MRNHFNLTQNIETVMCKTFTGIIFVFGKSRYIVYACSRWELKLIKVELSN